MDLSIRTGAAQDSAALTSRSILNAAAGSSDPARADELLALTKERLGPAALYQAEKTADWIRLKAAVKAREAKRALEWARGHAPSGR